MKKLLYVLLSCVCMVTLSCSSGDDAPSGPPKIDVTKLYGEWKQMPSKSIDSYYGKEEYYHSLNISDDFTFTGIWNGGYDEGIDDYEYTRVRGRIVVDGNKLALHQNFYDENGEFDETEIMEGLEVITLTDDILVLREKDYYGNSHIGYYYYGFYREHAADMLPSLEYESLLKDVEIRIYDANGYVTNKKISFPYSNSAEYIEAKVVVTTLDNNEYVLEDEYITFSVESGSYFVEVSRENIDSNDFNLEVYDNTSSLSRTAVVKLFAPYLTIGGEAPEISITVTQSGKPSSGGNTGGSTGGNTGGSTGGNTGGNTGGSTGGSSGGSSSSDKYFVKTVTTCEILQVSNNVSINSSSKTMYLYQSPTGSYYLKTSKSSENMYMVTDNVSSYVYSGDHSKKISVSKWDYCGKRYSGLSTYYYFFDM